MGEVVTAEMVSDVTAIEALTRGEVDVQIATAHRFPRSPEKSLATAKKMALRNQETAGSMFYSVPRDGKMIQGPSVRLAEIFATTWGNLRAQARIIEEGARFLVAQGVAHDLENNLAVNVEVRRRITGKSGRRYSDDMIQTTANAACAIAIRQAVFKVIPRVFVDELYEEARRVAVGDYRTIRDRADKVLQRLAQIGVPEERVLAHLGRESRAEITPADVETMIGLGTAIKDGDMTAEEIGPPDDPQDRPIQVNGDAFNKPEAATDPEPSKEKAKKGQPTDDAPADADAMVRYWRGELSKAKTNKQRGDTLAMASEQLGEDAMQELSAFAEELANAK